MKKIILLVFTLLTGIISTDAQKNDNSLLWKISGNGLSQESYLYGTFHLLCPDDIQISDKVTKAFEASGQLVLELDMDDPSIMPAIQQSMVFTDGTTAKDYLNESEYKLVAGFFNDSLGLPFEKLQVIKPFFLSSMTVLHFLGCQPASFEQGLIKLANEQEIEVKGLETVEEQVSFINNLSMETQKKMLLENLEKYDSSKIMFNKMVDYYMNEQLEQINAISEEYMSDDYADMKEEMLIKRNENWIQDIRELITHQSTFIAVGAGHLPGEKGVIDLLRKAGYTVEPVH